jgi:hypothetical protein
MSEDKKTGEKILAWHFLSSDWTAHGGFKVEIGKTYKHEGPVEPCRSGLHASVKALDANSFCKGPVVTRVECSGTIVPHDEKLACSERTALWGYDATEELRAFARWAALKVAHLWPKNSLMPEVVRQYLESGDESIRVEARKVAYHASADASYHAASSYAASSAAAYAAADADVVDAAHYASSYAADAAYYASDADAEKRLAARTQFLDDANAELERLLVEGAKKRGLIGD